MHFHVHIGPSLRVISESSVSYSTREHELHLLQTAKNCAIELEKQKNELEKADNFPESSNTDVSKYRAELLKHHNELAQIEDRQYQQDYKLERSGHILLWSLFLSSSLLPLHIILISWSPVFCTASMKRRECLKKNMQEFPSKG